MCVRKWWIVAAVTVGLVALSGGSARAAVCDDPEDGLLACDVEDNDCPRIVTYAGDIALARGWRADYASYPEARTYLQRLATLKNDPDSYLHLFSLGESVAMDLDLQTQAGSTNLGSGPVIAARITQRASDFDDTKPAILAVCAVHSLEWIPAEACLNYVDYLVRTANRDTFYNAAQREETEAVREMLSRVEIWVVTHATPGGRLYDEKLTGTGDPTQSQNGQYKNYQWRDDRQCDPDWENQKFSGRCDLQTEWSDGDWDQLGVNVARSFSSGWGSPSPKRFTREMIVNRPNMTEADVMPEMFDCEDPGTGNPDDSKCARFVDHPHCIRYVDPTTAPDPTAYFGCFMERPFPDDVGIAVGNDGRTQCINSIQSDALGIHHAGCLRTQTRSPATGDSVDEWRYLLWECGNDQQADVLWESVNGVWTDTANPVLLQKCRRGILHSCNVDADCHDPTVAGSDFHVPAMGANHPPHEMANDLLDDHLFCKERACATSSLNSCCSEQYAGQTPFESIESRIIRQLINNVPFSFIFDMHASGNFLRYICTQWNGGCNDTDQHELNGGSMLDQMLDAYYARSSEYWDDHYGGIPENITFPAMPDLLTPFQTNPGDPGKGQLPPWTSSPVPTTGYGGYTFPESAANFDQDTFRGVPSFLWELGLPKNSDGNPTYPKSNADELALYKRLSHCDNDGNPNNKPFSGGSRVRSRFLLEHQLEGMKEMFAYVADQAASPDPSTLPTSPTVAWTMDRTGPVVPTPAGPGAVGRRNISLTAFLVHDDHGRGVQQTELRWDHIKDDPTAEVAAGSATPGDVLNVDLYWTIRNQQTGITDVLPTQSFTLTAGHRRKVTTRYTFEAGQVYDAVAEIAGHNDTWADIQRRTKFKVLDCRDDDLPNGYGSHGFCRGGAPFWNTDFSCSPDRKSVV
jgi:hypothetical protein